ncbi:DnaJ C-terminal domain-containing protein, partial [Chloroflexota bacterium]
MHLTQPQRPCCQPRLIIIATFKRHDDDILYDLAVNFAQAALGAEIEVPTLDSPFGLKIP